MELKIAPSLAAGPLDRLGEVVSDLEQAGADFIHFDIEDGVFVQAMTLGVGVIRHLRPLSNLPFDVHLMVNDPEWMLPELAAYGVDRVSVHYEACPYPRRILRRIRYLGMKAGLALNPATPLPDLHYLLPHLQFVVVLTTEPEIPDCPFLPEILEKVRSGGSQPALAGLEWVVDGDVNQKNVRQVAMAGAHTIVVGRAAFARNTLKSNLEALRQAGSIKGSRSSP